MRIQPYDERWIQKNFCTKTEFTQLSNAIGLVNTFVLGPIDSGKTIPLKHVIERHNTANNKRTVSIDCSLYQTNNVIFHKINK